MPDVRQERAEGGAMSATKMQRANDKLPIGEMGLARELQELHVLFEPGKERTQRLKYIVQWWSNRSWPWW